MLVTTKAIRPAPAMPPGTGLGGTGGLAGTPAYMAPELWAGSVADARSDQFAFAVSLFEGLCGARPHGGTTLVELREAIVAGTTSELPAPAEPVGLVAPPLTRDAFRRQLGRAEFFEKREYLSFPE